MQFPDGTPFGLQARKKIISNCVFLHISSFLQCVRCTLHVTKSEKKQKLTLIAFWWVIRSFPYVHFHFRYAVRYFLAFFSLVIPSQSWVIQKQRRDVAAFELIIWHVFVQENGAKLKLFGGQRKIEFLWDFRTMITVISPAAAAASSWLAVLFVCCKTHSLTLTECPCECINLIIIFCSSVSLYCHMHASASRAWCGLTFACGNAGKCNLMDNELQQWILCILLLVLCEAPSLNVWPLYVRKLVISEHKA